MARPIFNTHEFETEAEAKAFAEDFRAQWAHGYDGMASVSPPKVAGEKWIVSTTRYDSCD